MDLILDQMQNRVENDRIDGDSGYFDAVMLQGELLTKLTLLGALALLDPDIDARYRYDVEHSLVRADGVGAWSYELQRLITGPAKSAFFRGAGTLVAQLSQRVPPGSDEWQRVALDELTRAERALGVEGIDPKSRTALTTFFSRFTQLRNKSRGHGAQHVSDKGTAALHLSVALQTISQNLKLLRQEWFGLIRKSSGALRLYPLSAQIRESQVSLGEAPVELDEGLKEGVYLLLDGNPLLVHLLHVCEPLDVTIANGGYNDAKSTYEEISYVHGQAKVVVSAQDYLASPSLLADSETHGLLELDLQGQTWANLPLRKPDYVRRGDLEEELRDRLLDRELDPIITLGGPGGIGKTSTALQVLHEIAEEGSFDLILWFSARDIDLLDAEGAVPVKPRVLSFGDAAKDFARLAIPMGFAGSDPDSGFAAALRGDDNADRTLFVFDNFETILEPVMLFRVLKSHLRLPNKLLITTRFTDFKGQYPVDVTGMQFDEFEQLVNTTASRLGIVSLINQSTDYVRGLHRESYGHPYIVKIVLGEIARDGRIPARFERVISRRDDILDALFFRSFERLSADAQRVFLTLCSWRSVVPLVMLEAALRRSSNDEPVDVEEAIEELATSSMVEVLRPAGHEEPRWINVPGAAFSFGATRLLTHRSASTVKADRQYIALLGPTKNTSVETNEIDFAYFFGRVRECLKEGSLPEQDLMDVVDHLCSATSYAWRLAVRVLADTGRTQKARSIMMRDAPSNILTWDSDDLRFRYELLRKLLDSRTVETALVLLPKLVRDGDYRRACSVVVDLASAFQARLFELKGSQKRRLDPEVLKPFRDASRYVDADAARALAGLVALADAPDSGDEVTMWTNIAKHRQLSGAFEFRLLSTSKVSTQCIRSSADSGGGRAPGYAFGPDRSSGWVRQFEATLASGLEW